MENIASGAITFALPFPNHVWSGCALRNARLEIGLNVQYNGVPMLDYLFNTLCTASYCVFIQCGLWGLVLILSQEPGNEVGLHAATHGKLLIFLNFIQVPITVTMYMRT